MTKPYTFEYAEVPDSACGDEDLLARVKACGICGADVRGATGRKMLPLIMGHEVAHVANGDMVTLTLIQGVLNTFVIFIARIIASQFDRGRFLIYIALQMAFGVLASVVVAWFSRRREFRADAGGAQFESPTAMASALNKLRTMQNARSQLPDGLTAFGIRGGGMLKLLSTHPPLEERIARLS